MSKSMKQLHNSLTMYDLCEHTFEHTPISYALNFGAKSEKVLCKQAYLHYYKKPMKCVNF